MWCHNVCTREIAYRTCIHKKEGAGTFVCVCVCVCVGVCVCVHIYLSICSHVVSQCMYTWNHIYTPTHIKRSVFVHLCVCLCVCVSVCVCVCVSAHSCLFLCSFRSCCKQKQRSKRTNCASWVSKLRSETWRSNVTEDSLKKSPSSPLRHVQGRVTKDKDACHWKFKKEPFFCSPARAEAQD